jgi:hypothetical protein
VAHPHRRRAGVVGLTGQREFGPGNALHALDRANRQTFRLQRRPLLDVQFDVSVDVRLADRRVAAIADALEFVAGFPAVDADRFKRPLAASRR